MVKSGSFKVSQGSTAGRFGESLGKGLAESLPKEVAQQRLSSGLKNFAQTAQGLTPLEQYTQLLSIPGIQPQAIQQLPDVLRQQNIRQAYIDKANAGNNYQNQEQVQESQQKYGSIGSQGREPNLSNSPQMAKPGSREEPQIQEKNPLRPEAVPRIRWSDRRLEQEVGRVLQEGLAFTPQEAFGIAKQREERELSLPQDVQKQDAYFREQQDLVDDAFDKKLSTKLEKAGTDVFKDLTGETLNNLKRSMYKDLRTAGPEVSAEDVADYWTNKALDVAKTKTQLSELSGKNIFNKLSSSKENLSKLKSYQKIFAETGNQEEYYNILRDNFNISPQGAASIAYPISSGVRSYVDSVKPTKTSDVSFIPAKSRKYATEIENKLNSDDSLLAIARDLRQKDPGFNQRSFFDQLREDQDNLALNARQKRELAQGESEAFLNWGDLLYFPLYRD